MSDVTFVRREHLGSGNYEYTYRCRCESGTASEIKVTTGNTAQAEALARMECDANCGEARNAMLRSEYIKAVKPLMVPIQPSYAFVVRVNEVTDDAYIVTLCSGDQIMLPQGMVKRFRPLGSLKLDGDDMTHIVARIQLDPDFPGTMTVFQLATALERQLGSVTSGSDDDKNGEVCEQIKVGVSGMVCNSAFGYFVSKYPLTGAELARAEGCQAWDLQRIGQTQVRFKHSGPAGAPCQNGYNGIVYIDICYIR
ncbi:hypothetical protein ACFPN1_14965 [Lysobacter yangpyeongensis]|uniref:Uncharacterized protein n=1 Tax=Lysobacter yangpyeongensis TaxID=346182 RepID=A0ABW0SR31_9GAMM